jgi:hypothetical protein
MDQRLGITAVLDAVLDRRKTRISLVFAAALHDRNTSELFVRTAHSLR